MIYHESIDLLIMTKEGSVDVEEGCGGKYMGGDKRDGPDVGHEGHPYVPLIG